MAELSVPQINFSALGELPGIYKQNQADQLRQQTLANLGQGGAVDANTLLRSGDLSLAQLGINLRNRQEEQARQAQQDAESARRWGADYKLRQAQLANSEDYTPEELDARRVTQLKAAGVDLNSPEARGFRISGTWAGPGGNEASLNPVYGVGPDGKPAMVQTTKSGNAIQTKLPDGFQIAKEPIKVDSGTHWTFLDPQTRQTIRTEPKNLAETEAQGKVGEAQGKARAALANGADTNAVQTIKQIDEFVKHPGFNEVFGQLDQYRPSWTHSNAGTGALARYKQLKGKAFLSAYEMLKGGGAITDIEGQKAGDAMARLDRAQSEDEAKQALADFKEAVSTGVQKLRRAAGSPSDNGGTAQPGGGAPQPGGVVDFSTYFGS